MGNYSYPVFLNLALSCKKLGLFESTFVISQEHNHKTITLTYSLGFKMFLISFTFKQKWMFEWTPQILSLLDDDKKQVMEDVFEEQAA